MSERMTVAAAIERAWASGSDGEPETWVEELREAAQVLADEVDRLRAEAERYRYVRDQLAICDETINHSARWRFYVLDRHGSSAADFDADIDKLIAEDAGK